MWSKNLRDLLSAFRAFLLGNIQEYSLVENLKNHLKISAHLFLST